MVHDLQSPIASAPVQKSLSLRDPAGPSPGSFLEGLWSDKAFGNRGRALRTAHGLLSTLWGSVVSEEANFANCCVALQSLRQGTSKGNGKTAAATAGSGSLAPPGLPSTSTPMLLISEQ